MMNKKKLLYIIAVKSLVFFFVLGLGSCAVFSTLDKMAAANQPPVGYGVLSIDNKTQLGITMVEVKGVHNTDFTNSYQVNIRPGTKAEVGEVTSEYNAPVLPAGAYQVILHWSDNTTSIDNNVGINGWIVWVVNTSNL